MVQVLLLVDSAAQYYEALPAWLFVVAMAEEAGVFSLMIVAIETASAPETETVIVNERLFEMKEEASTRAATALSHRQDEVQWTRALSCCCGSGAQARGTCAASSASCDGRGRQYRQTLRRQTS